MANPSSRFDSATRSADLKAKEDLFLITLPSSSNAVRSRASQSLYRVQRSLEHNTMSRENMDVFIRYAEHHVEAIGLMLEYGGYRTEEKRFKGEKGMIYFTAWLEGGRELKRNEDLRKGHMEFEGMFGVM